MLAVNDRSRKAMIAKIHIAKKELNLNDYMYRYILKETTGKDSCKIMTHQELDRVLQVLCGLGFSPKKKASINEFGPDKDGIIRNLTRIAETTMGMGWKKRIRGYIRKKFGVDDLRFLSYRQLTDVFAFVRAIQRKEEPF